MHICFFAIFCVLVQRACTILFLSQLKTGFLKNFMYVKIDTC